ncbi:MAG: YdcF family protein [Gemmatimonadales bacterium]
MPQRNIRRFLPALALLALALYLASFVAVYLASRTDQHQPADAIVVLGAAQYNGKPSPVLRARLDHAVELYREGLAPAVVVTGGIGTGDRVSEATVSRQYLVAKGVPDQAIVVRPEGRSTHESMRSVAEWARVHEARRVLLVSDPFHMLRLRLEARRSALAAYTSPTSSSPISADWTRELFFFAAEAWKVPVVLLGMER